MCDSLELLLLAIMAPAIHCLWHLSSWEEAFITTVSVDSIVLGIQLHEPNAGYNTLQWTGV